MKNGEIPRILRTNMADNPINELIGKGPKLITASAKSPLGIVALTILVAAVLGFNFFTGASENVRIWMFALMFIGYMILCLSVLATSASRSRLKPPNHVGPHDAPRMKPDNAGSAESNITVKRPGMTETPSSFATIPLRLSFKRLGILWGTAIGVMGLFMLTRLLLGYYGGQREFLDVWAWIGPALLPPTSVVTVGFACSFWDNRERSRSVHSACIWISSVYLALIFATVSLEPFVQSVPPFDSESQLLKGSTLLLTPLEGILVGLTALLLAWAKPHPLDSSP